MKMTKKCICILLALIMAAAQMTCVAAVYGIAEGVQTPTDLPTGTDAPEPGDDPDEIVATVSIYGRVRSLFTSGHTWIYVENISDRDLTVALETIGPRQGVSFGTFFLSRYDGAGLYYNIETYCGNLYGTSGCVSITEEITAEQLAALSDKLLNSNNFGLFNNCTQFTISVWNSVAKKKILPIPIPWVTFFLIGLAGQPDRPMYFTSAEDVSKQIGNGESAYLVPVSEKSLRNPV